MIEEEVIGIDVTGTKMEGIVVDVGKFGRDVEVTGIGVEDESVDITEVESGAVRGVTKDDVRSIALVESGGAMISVEAKDVGLVLGEAENEEVDFVTVETSGANVVLEGNGLVEVGSTTVAIAEVAGVVLEVTCGRGDIVIEDAICTVVAGSGAAVSVVEAEDISIVVGVEYK